MGSWREEEDKRLLSELRGRGLPPVAARRLRPSWCGEEAGEGARVREDDVMLPDLASLLVCLAIAVIDGHRRCPSSIELSFPASDCPLHHPSPAAMLLSHN